MYQLKMWRDRPLTEEGSREKKNSYRHAHLSINLSSAYKKEGTGPAVFDTSAQGHCERCLIKMPSARTCTHHFVLEK